MPYLCIRFSGNALMNIFIDLKEQLDQFGVNTTDITEFPSYFYTSRNLNSNGYVNKIEEDNSKTENI